MQPTVAARRSVRAFLLTLCTTVLLATLTVCIPANAQTSFTRIYGPVDRDIPVPALVGALGRKDAGALAVLQAYRKAVNVADWQGMQASGTYTDSAENTGSATLTILNGGQFRLDVETPNGERSTRISGSVGQILEANGKTNTLPPATARAGLLAFPQLLVTNFPAPDTSLIDRGLTRISGALLHRITLEEPVFPDADATSSQVAVVTDLYFDPSTNLLIKSATAVRLSGADRELYLVVITYGDYQKVQDMLVPCLYSQSLNGQPQWTLRLNSPTLQSSVDSSYFVF